jgi:Putative MetA-pathway of phenol degradation
MLVLGSVSPHLVVAQGGPPLLTDDPETPGDRNWEINAAATWEHRGQGWYWEAPLLDINYGWGAHLQLKYEIPYLLQDTDATRVQSGLGNSLLGIKWRFLDVEQHGIAVSVYPQVEFNNPTSSRRRGLVNGHTAVLLPVEIARKFGRFSVNLEVGYTVIEREKDEWLYGLAAGYEVYERLQLIGELHGVTQTQGAEDELIFQVGVRQEITKHVGLLFAIGHGLRAPQGEAIMLLGYFGVQCRL